LHAPWGLLAEPGGVGAADRGAAGAVGTASAERHREKLVAGSGRRRREPAWNRHPTPFAWGGKRAACRQRARERRHRLGGSGGLPQEAERVDAIVDHLSAQRATDVLLFSLAFARWEFLFQPTSAPYLNRIEP